MVFSDLDKLGLSEFYQVRVANEAAELTRVVLIPTCGFPDDREGAVVNSIIKDKTTFVEYMTLKRMEKAKELLLTTKAKGHEISEQVGYKDPHYFSYIFKKTYGLSPKEFRLQGQENDCEK